MEARQGRDAAGGSMRHAHDSVTGHVSWPGTHSLQCLMHKLMRQSSGNRFDSDYCGQADPAQPVRRSLRGAKHRAAGIARRAFPWRQAKRAAPQARRREGLKPNGRDGKGGTGRSPKARRRIAPTRPGRSIFSERNPRQAHDTPAPTRNPGRHCCHRGGHGFRLCRCAAYQPHRAIHRAGLARCERTDAFHRGRRTRAGCRPRRAVAGEDHR